MPDLKDTNARGNPADSIKRCSLLSRLESASRGKFVILLYIFLILFLTDYILFHQGLMWTVGVMDRGTRVYDLISLKKRVPAFKKAEKTNPDSTKIVALGSSIVGKGFDSKLIESALAERYPPKDFEFFTFHCANARCFESFYVLDHIIDDGVNVCVYGFHLLDFIGLERVARDADNNIRMGGVDRGGLSKESPIVASYCFEQLAPRESVIEEVRAEIDVFLRRYWGLFREKALVKEIIRLKYLANRDSKIRWRKRGSERREKVRILWESWKKTRDKWDYLDYVDTRGGRFDFSPNPETYRRTYPNPAWRKPENMEYIEINLKYLARMIELCRQKKVPLILVYMPINPILKDFGVHKHDEFIETTLKPFCVEHNASLYDLSDRSKIEFFKNMNHLNIDGREDFSRLIGDVLAYELAASGLIPAPKKPGRDLSADN